MLKEDGFMSRGALALHEAVALKRLMGHLKQLYRSTDTSYDEGA